MFRLLLTFFAVLFFAMPLFAQIIDTAWVRSYNGPGDGMDIAYDIAVDDSGNVYITGQSDYSAGNPDFVTIKYFTNGDTAWIRRYDAMGDEDVANAIAVDDSGNVYVTGKSYVTGTLMDLVTIKYSPNGNTAWIRRYAGTGLSDDEAMDIAIDASNNIYVTGYTYGSGTSHDYTTIKYLSNGDTAWVKKYNGPASSSDKANAIALDGSGNVYVTGSSYGSGSYEDYTTIKYYSNGDTAWVRRYNSTADSIDRAKDIAVDEFGNVYITGDSYNNGTFYDYTTIKYDSIGTPLWIRSYNGTRDTNDYAKNIAIDNSGNACVTGYAHNNDTYRDYTTIKYLPNGDTSWIRTYNEVGGYGDYAEDLVIDEFNNIYVTGSSGDGSTISDLATIKYYPNGDTAWVRRYNGPGNSLDQGYAIATGGSHKTYVTGTTDRTGGFEMDIVTIKYAPLQRNDTLLYMAFSPVDLIVTDPVGDSIGIDFNTIADATYDTTQDVNEDGENDDVVTIPKPLIGEYTVRVVAEPGSEGGSYTLSVKLDGNEDTPMGDAISAPGPSEVDTFYYSVFEYLRGDANSDGATSISDVIYTINYLFKGGDPPEPSLLGDANCCKEGDGNCDVVEISVSDVIYLINYLFKGGTAPCS